jgi:glycosyltransferase involved in cell wall biosynthesis
VTGREVPGVTPPAAEIDISLIICTRNRCKQLSLCLESLQHIEFERPWELIVIDNGSTDETGSVIREFMTVAGIRGVYVFEPGRGKSTALNTALRRARGRVLAFTDDDCYPAPDFLKRIWSAFADPTVGYITGRIILHDPEDYPITINESTTPRTFPGRSFICAGTIHGANMAFRRVVLFAIDGFDPLFGPGAFFVAEELDAAGRASALGWKGEYRPEIVVRHHHGRKASDVPALWKSYAIGRGAYHMKLLLREREFLWFARSVYQLRWRYRTSPGTIFWEQVGAMQYARMYVRLFTRSLWAGRWNANNGE